MNQTEEAQQSLLSQAVCQQLDEWLGDFYGGFLDKRTLPDIQSGLAGALDSEGVSSDDLWKAIEENGFSPFDRADAQRIAARAIQIARAEEHGTSCG